MKKVYLDDLSKRGSKQIDWNRSIGYKVKFIYEDIEGKIEIVGYKDRYLELLYNNKIISMITGNFQKCYLGELLDVVTKQYKYNIGDIVNELKILDCIRVKNGKNTQKGYKVKCINDGYVHEKTEKDLDHGNRCPVCCNQKIIKGINDIATTHPHLIKYFADIEDIYKYSQGSDKKVILKCLDCGSKKNMSISKLSYYGFSCSKCSDGKSYPEKFVFNLLDQLNVYFTTEKVFDWLKNKRYDFYIPEFNCIIETHGEQHYNGNFASLGGNNLCQEQENNRHKKEIALVNGIKHYIVLDCRKSDMEYIKNSILNSELNKLFDLTKIDWLKYHEFACNSRVKEACDLWNNGVESSNDISKRMKLDKSAIIRYLKQGTGLGWCNYNSREVHLKSNRINAKRNAERCRKKCTVILGKRVIEYNSMKECLEKNNFSRSIFDKLVKSKEPFKPNPRYHKHLMHLEGMRIEYI